MEKSQQGGRRVKGARRSEDGGTDWVGEYEDVSATRIWKT